MDIIRRLVQIAGSYANSAFESVFSPRKSWKTPPKYRHTYSQKAETTSSNMTYANRIDPVLAGYYANLEIPYGSNIETAKTAWKHLLKKYHPDIHSNDPEKRQIATELTKRLNEAYHAIEKAIIENRV